MSTTQTHFGQTRFVHRLTALFVAICLLFLDTKGVGAQFIASSEGRDKSRPYIFIPESLGRIEESFRGTSGKTILYIQDAHDSLDAQVHIAKLIELWVRRGILKTVFEEGYEGPVPTEKFFGIISDPSIKQKISYFLMDKLRIGGAEYAHINRPHRPHPNPLPEGEGRVRGDFKLIGIDNIALHKENLRAYREAYKKKNEIEADLILIRKKLEPLAQRSLPEALKKFLRLRKDFESEKISLTDYLKRISSSGDLKDFPTLSVVMALEGSNRPELAKIAGDIDMQTLLDEIQKAENAVIANKAASDRDKKICVYLRILDLLERLYRLEVTEEEFIHIRRELAGFKTRSIADFVSRESGKSVVLYRGWEEAIRQALRFYEIAIERDKSIEAGIARFAEDPHEKTTALVFGGFHKSAIKKILKEKGISYFVISPKIKDQDTRHRNYYRQLMAVGHHPFEAAAAQVHASTPERIFEWEPARIDNQISWLVRKFSAREGHLVRFSLKSPRAGTFRIQSDSVETGRSELRTSPDFFRPEKSEMQAKERVKGWVLGWVNPFRKSPDAAENPPSVNASMRQGICYGLLGFTVSMMYLTLGKMLGVFEVNLSNQRDQISLWLLGNALLFAPAIEEWISKRILYEGARLLKLSPSVSNFIQASFSAAMHYIEIPGFVRTHYYPLALFPDKLISGIFNGWAYQKGGFQAALISHQIANGMSIMLALYPMPMISLVTPILAGGFFVWGTRKFFAGKSTPSRAVLPSNFQDYTGTVYYPFSLEDLESVFDLARLFPRAKLVLNDAFVEGESGEISGMPMANDPDAVAAFLTDHYQRKEGVKNVFIQVLNREDALLGIEIRLNRRMAARLGRKQLAFQFRVGDFKKITLDAGVVFLKRPGLEGKLFLDLSLWNHLRQGITEPGLLLISMQDAGWIQERPDSVPGDWVSLFHPANDQHGKDADIQIGGYPVAVYQMAGRTPSEGPRSELRSVTEAPIQTTARQRLGDLDERLDRRKFTLDAEMVPPKYLNPKSEIFDNPVSLEQYTQHVRQVDEWVDQGLLDGVTFRDAPDLNPETIIFLQKLRSYLRERNPDNPFTEILGDHFISEWLWENPASLGIRGSSAARRSFDILREIDRYLELKELPVLPKSLIAPVAAQVRGDEDLRPRLRWWIDEQNARNAFLISGGHPLRKIVRILMSGLPPEVESAIFPNVIALMEHIKSLHVQGQIDEMPRFWLAWDQYQEKSVRRLREKIDHALKINPSKRPVVVTQPAYLRQAFLRKLWQAMEAGLMDKADFKVGMMVVTSAQSLRTMLGYAGVDPEKDPDTQRELERWQEVEKENGGKAPESFIVEWNVNQIYWVKELPAINGIRFFMGRDEKTWKLLPRILAAADLAPEARLQNDVRTLSRVEVIQPFLKRTKNAGLRSVSYPRILENPDLRGSVEPLLNSMAEVFEETPSLKKFPGRIRLYPYWLQYPQFYTHFRSPIAVRPSNHSWFEIAVNLKEYAGADRTAQAIRLKEELRQAVMNLFINSGEDSEDIYLDPAPDLYEKSFIFEVSDRFYRLPRGEAISKIDLNDKLVLKDAQDLIETMREVKKAADLGENSSRRPIYEELSISGIQRMRALIEKVYEIAAPEDRNLFKALGLMYRFTDFSRPTLDHAEADLAIMRRSEPEFERKVRELGIDFTFSHALAEEDDSQQEAAGEQLVVVHAANLFDAMRANYFAQFDGVPNKVLVQAYLPAREAGLLLDRYGNAGLTRAHLAIISQGRGKEFLDLFQQKMGDARFAGFLEELANSMRTRETYEAWENTEDYDWVRIDGVPHPNQILRDHVTGNVWYKDSRYAIQTLLNRSKRLHPAGYIEGIQFATTQREIKWVDEDFRKMRRGGAVIMPLSLDLVRAVMRPLGFDVSHESFQNYDGKLKAVKRLVIRRPAARSEMRLEIQEAKVPQPGSSGRDPKQGIFDLKVGIAEPHRQLLLSLIPSSVLGNRKNEVSFLRWPSHRGKTALKFIFPKDFDYEIEVGFLDDGDALILDEGRIRGKPVEEFGREANRYLNKYPNPFFAWWFQTHLLPFAKTLGYRAVLIATKPEKISPDTLTKLGFELIPGTHNFYQYLIRTGSRSEMRSESMRDMEKLVGGLITRIPGPESPRDKKSRILLLVFLGNAVYKFAVQNYLAAINKNPGVSLEMLNRAAKFFRSNDVLSGWVPEADSLYRRYAAEKSGQGKPQHSQGYTLKILLGNLAAMGDVKLVSEILFPYFQNVKWNDRPLFTKQKMTTSQELTPLIKRDEDRNALHELLKPFVNSKFKPSLLLDERHSIFGDAILDLIIASELWGQYGAPRSHAEYLRHFDSPFQQLKSDKTLAAVMEVNLKAVGSRLVKRGKAYQAALFEALVAAVYVANGGFEGKGLEQATEFVLSMMRRSDAGLNAGAEAVLGTFGSKRRSELSSMPNASRTVRSEVRKLRSELRSSQLSGDLIHTAEELAEKLTDKIDPEIYRSKIRPLLQLPSRQVYGALTTQENFESLTQALPFVNDMMRKPRYGEGISVFGHSMEILRRAHELADGNLARFNQDYDGWHFDDETARGYQTFVKNATPEDRELLNLAVLFHDIGVLIQVPKHPAIGAVMVPVLLKKMGFPEKDIRLVQWLVDHHVDLSTLLSGERKILWNALEEISVEQREKAIRFLTLLTIGESRSVYQPERDRGKFIEKRNAVFYLQAADPAKLARLKENFYQHRLERFCAEGGDAGDVNEQKYQQVLSIIQNDMPRSEKKQFIHSLREIEIFDYANFFFQALDAQALVKSLFLLSQIEKAYGNQPANVIFNAPTKEAAKTAQAVQAILSSFDFVSLLSGSRNFDSVLKKLKISVDLEHREIRWDNAGLLDIKNAARQRGWVTKADIFSSPIQKLSRAARRKILSLVPETILKAEGKLLEIRPGANLTLQTNGDHFFVKISLLDEGTNLHINEGLIQGEAIREFAAVRNQYAQYRHNSFFAWWYQTRLVPFARTLGFETITIEDRNVRPETLEKLGFVKSDSLYRYSLKALRSELRTLEEEKPKWIEEIRLSVAGGNLNHLVETLWRLEEQKVRGLGELVYEASADDEVLRNRISEWYFEIQKMLGFPELSPEQRVRWETAYRALDNIGIGEIVFVAAESQGFSQAGGLAMVIANLSEVFSQIGIHVTVILPFYESKNAALHSSFSDIMKSGVEIQGQRIFPRRIGSVPIAIGPAYYSAPIDSPMKSVVPGDPARDLNLKDPAVYEKYRGRVHRGKVYLAESGKIRFLLMRSPELADKIYSKQDGSDGELRRAIFLSRGSLEVMRKLGIRPYLIQPSEKDTALIPAFIQYDPRYKDFADTSIVLWVHNNAYQGRMHTNEGVRIESKGKFFNTHIDLFPRLDLPPVYDPSFQYEQFTDPKNRDKLNLLASAYRHLDPGKDAVMTVSPGYAVEIATQPEFGEGLEGLLHPFAEAGELYGISNGINEKTLMTKYWKMGEAARMKLGLPPLTANLTEQGYREQLPAYKEAVLQEIQGDYGLQRNKNALLISFSGRVAEQKGVELFTRMVRDPFVGDDIPAIELMLRYDPVVQILIGGPVAKGDQHAEKLEVVVDELTKKYPGRIAGKFQFLPHDELLRITLASSLFLMPSRFEPGGITHLEAKKAGTASIARSIGGIRSTLRDVIDGGNAFLFYEFTSEALLHAAYRAIVSEKDTSFRESLARRLARENHDWQETVAPRYQAFYQRDILDLYPHLGTRKKLLDATRVQLPQGVPPKLRGTRRKKGPQTFKTPDDLLRAVADQLTSFSVSYQNGQYQMAVIGSRVENGVMNRQFNKKRQLAADAVKEETAALWASHTRVFEAEMKVRIRDFAAGKKMLVVGGAWFPHDAAFILNDLPQVGKVVVVEDDQEIVRQMIVKYLELPDNWKEKIEIEFGDIRNLKRRYGEFNVIYANNVIEPELAEGVPLAKLWMEIYRLLTPEGVFLGLAEYEKSDQNFHRMFDVKTLNLEEPLNPEIVFARKKPSSRSELRNDVKVEEGKNGDELNAGTSSSFQNIAQSKVRRPALTRQVDGFYQFIIGTSHGHRSEIRSAADILKEMKHYLAAKNYPEPKLQQIAGAIELFEKASQLAAQKKIVPAFVHVTQGMLHLDQIEEDIHQWKGEQFKSHAEMIMNAVEEGKLLDLQRQNLKTWWRKLDFWLSNKILIWTAPKKMEEEQDVEAIQLEMQKDETMSPLQSQLMVFFELSQMAWHCLRQWVNVHALRDYLELNSDRQLIPKLSPYLEAMEEITENHFRNLDQARESLEKLRRQWIEVLAREKGMNVSVREIKSLESERKTVYISGLTGKEERFYYLSLLFLGVVTGNEIFSKAANRLVQFSIFRQGEVKQVTGVLFRREDIFDHAYEQVARMTRGAMSELNDGIQINKIADDMDKFMHLLEREWNKRVKRTLRSFIKNLKETIQNILQGDYEASKNVAILNDLLQKAVRFRSDLPLEELIAMRETLSNIARQKDVPILSVGFALNDVNGLVYLIRNHHENRSELRSDIESLLQPYFQRLNQLQHHPTIWQKVSNRDPVDVVAGELAEDILDHPDSRTFIRELYDWKRKNRLQPDYEKLLAKVFALVDFKEMRRGVIKMATVGPLGIHLLKFPDLAAGRSPVPLPKMGEDVGSYLLRIRQSIREAALENFGIKAKDVFEDIPYREDGTPGDGPFVRIYTDTEYGNKGFIIRHPKASLWVWHHLVRPFGSHSWGRNALWDHPDIYPFRTRSDGSGFFDDDMRKIPHVLKRRIVKAAADYVAQSVRMQNFIQNLSEESAEAFLDLPQAERYELVNSLVSRRFDFLKRKSEEYRRQLQQLEKEWQSLTAQLIENERNQYESISGREWYEHEEVSLWRKREAVDKKIESTRRILQTLETADQMDSDFELQFPERDYKVPRTYDEAMARAKKGGRYVIEEVGAAVRFLKGPDWRRFYEEFWASPQYQELENKRRLNNRSELRPKSDDFGTRKKLAAGRSELRSENKTPAAVIQLPLLIEEILDPAKRNRSLEEWKGLHWKFFNSYFAPKGPATPMERKALEIVTQSLSADFRRTYDQALVPELVLTHNLVRYPAESHLKIMKVFMLMSASRFVRVFQGLKTTERLGLPPKPGPEPNPQQTTREAYKGWMKQKIVHVNIVSNMYLFYAPISHAEFLRLPHPSDHEKIVFGAPSILQTLAYLESGFEPQISDFPKFARAILSNGIKSVSFLQGTPDNPPAIYAEFYKPYELPTVPGKSPEKIPSVAVFVLQESWKGRSRTHMKTGDFVSSESFLKELVFAESDDYQEVILPRTQKLLDLANTERLIVNSSYEESSLAAGELAELFSRDEAEREATLRQIEVANELVAETLGDPAKMEESTREDLSGRLTGLKMAVPFFKSLGLPISAALGEEEQSRIKLLDPEFIAYLQGQEFYREFLKLLFLLNSQGRFLIDREAANRIADQLDDLDIQKVLRELAPVLDTVSRNFKSAEEQRTFQAEFILALAFRFLTGSGTRLLNENALYEQLTQGQKRFEAISLEAAIAQRQSQIVDNVNLGLDRKNASGLDEELARLKDKQEQRRLIVSIIEFRRSDSIPLAEALAKFASVIPGLTVNPQDGSRLGGRDDNSVSSPARNQFQNISFYEQLISSRQKAEQGNELEAAALLEGLSFPSRAVQRRLKPFLTQLAVKLMDQAENLQVREKDERFTQAKMLISKIAETSPAAEVKTLDDRLSALKQAAFNRDHQKEIKMQEDWRKAYQRRKEDLWKELLRPVSEAVSRRPFEELQEMFKRPFADRILQSDAVMFEAVYELRELISGSKVEEAKKHLSGISGLELSHSAIFDKWIQEREEDLAKERPLQAEREKAVRSPVILRPEAEESTSGSFVPAGLRMTETSVASPSVDGIPPGQPEQPLQQEPPPLTEEQIRQKRQEWGAKFRKEKGKLWGNLIEPLWEKPLPSAEERKVYADKIMRRLNERLTSLDQIASEESADVSGRKEFGKFRQLVTIRQKILEGQYQQARVLLAAVNDDFTDSERQQIARTIFSPELREQARDIVAEYGQSVKQILARFVHLSTGLEGEAESVLRQMARGFDLPSKTKADRFQGTLLHFLETPHSQIPQFVDKVKKFHQTYISFRADAGLRSELRSTVEPVASAQFKDWVAKAAAMRAEKFHAEWKPQNRGEVTSQFEGITYYFSLDALLKAAVWMKSHTDQHNNGSFVYRGRGRQYRIEDFLPSREALMYSRVSPPKGTSLLSVQAYARKDVPNPPTTRFNFVPEELSFEILSPEDPAQKEIIYHVTLRSELRSEKHPEKDLRYAFAPATIMIDGTEVGPKALDDLFVLASTRSEARFIVYGVSGETSKRWMELSALKNVVITLADGETAYLHHRLRGENIPVIHFSAEAASRSRRRFAPNHRNKILFARLSGVGLLESVYYLLLFVGDRESLYNQLGPEGKIRFNSYLREVEQFIHDQMVIALAA